MSKLTVSLNTRQGLAPLKLTATIRGVGPTDEEVCVVTEGEDFYETECIVQNTSFSVSFILPTPGTYSFYATEGEEGPHSNHVEISVI